MPVPRPSRLWSKATRSSAVGRNVAGVLADVDRIGRGALVQTDVSELHPPKADDSGTVRILGRVGGGMVLTVHRYPLARPHTGGDPEDATERERDRRMDRQRPV